ncbi:MAG: choice-of-anchor F family protein [Planctomycetota bacterium]
MPASVHAGEITGVTWFSGVASVAGTGVAPPAAINNDNQVGTSPNVLFILQKDYVGIGPVDIVLDVIDSGGTTEYFVTEGVQNNTGLDWSGYHVELGFGTGAGFVKSAPGDGLDFDSPEFDSDLDFFPGGFFFPSVAATEDDLIAGGGVMPDFAFAGNFLFHVDVPDGITSFTIRQSPIPVPEPASIAALGVGVLALRRRRG